MYKKDMKRLVRIFVFGLFALSLVPTLLWSRSFTIPEANFIITPTVGEKDQPITFNASDSRSADGGKRLQYRWKFTPKDDWTSFSGNSIAKFTTNRTGSFRAQLQVKDTTTGITQNTYRTYRVSEPIPRRAHMYVSPLNPQYGEPVNFWVDVFKVRNEDIDDILVRWDFDGNGTWDTPFRVNKQASKVFGPNQVRSFRPIAEVRFKDGDIIKIRKITPRGRSNVSRTDFLTNQDSITPKIKVRSGGVVAPILDVSPGSYGPHPETQFIFDATRSRIPRGGWLEWSFDGDRFQKGPLFLRKQFDTPGKHTVRARTCTGITDQACSVSQATFEIKERPPQFLVNAFVQTIGNSRLTKVQLGLFNGSVGQSVQLSANVRSIDGRTIPGVEYRWDLDGDGRWDTAYSSSDRVTLRLDDVKRYRPTVEARSRDGFTAENRLVIDVRKNTEPKAEIIVRSQKVSDGFLVTFQPKVSDLESNTNALRTRFDLNGDGKWDTQFSSPRNAQWKYTRAGQYQIQMQVKDGNGAITIAKALLIVRNPGDAEPNLVANDQWTQEKPENDSSGSQNNSSTNTSTNGNNMPNQKLPVRVDDKTYPNQKLPVRVDTKVYPDKALPVRADTTNYLYTEDLSAATRSDYAGPLQTPPTFEIHKAFARFINQESEELGLGGNIEPYYQNPSLPSEELPINPYIPTAQGSNSGTNGSTSTTSGTSNPTTVTVNTVPAQIPPLQKRYRNTSIEPAYPGENPFTDISESDHYFPYALQAYRDGIVQGPVFWQ